MLINKLESGGLKYCREITIFIEYLNDEDNIYENIGEYNSNKKLKILILLDNMFSNKRLQPIVTELFSRSTKLNICLVFLYKVILDSTFYLLW